VLFLAGFIYVGSKPSDLGDLDERTLDAVAARSDGNGENNVWPAGVP
jgi:hypothetical protein